jgi:hypothetical protein
VFTYVLYRSLYHLSFLNGSVRCASCLRLFLLPDAKRSSACGRNSAAPHRELLPWLATERRGVLSPMSLLNQFETMTR